MEELVGEVVGEKYRLDELLGSGGAGAVFAAENTWTRKRVALKILVDQSDADDEMLARFRREARAASRFDHPNIVQVFDLGHEDDVGWYIVQELLEGEDLRARLLTKRRLSLREALGLLVPIGAALRSAHAGGVVHRDLKPANIFLQRRDDGVDVPKLIDFGISKMSHPDISTVSEITHGATIGTLDYMSPEQASGDAITPATDVWAFGTVLYHCLSGQPPFVAQGFAIIGKLLKEEPRRLDELEPSVPRSIADVVEACLRKDVADRTPSLGLVLRDLLHAPPVLATPWGRTLARRHRKDCDGELPPEPVEPRSKIGSWVPWAIAATSTAVTIWALTR